MLLSDPFRSPGHAPSSPSHASSSPTNTPSLSSNASSSSVQQPSPQPQNQMLPNHTDLDLDAVASSALQQSNSALRRLPLEIRDMIFAELWGAAGDLIHIMYRGGRFVRTECICDPVADKDRLDRDYDFYRHHVFRTGPRFVEFLRRYESTWGYHWRCEENCVGLLKKFEVQQEQEAREQDAAAAAAAASSETTSPPVPNTRCCCHNHRWEGLSWAADPCPSWFAVLISCKWLYLERRADIHRFVRFAIHDDVTLKHLLLPQPRRPVIPSLLRHATTVDLIMRFRLHYGAREISSWATWRIAELNQTWKQCCAALEKLVAQKHIMSPNHHGGGGNLASVNLWMDTVHPGGRAIFWDVQDEDQALDPYPFGPALTSVLNLDLPETSTGRSIQKDDRLKMNNALISLGVVALATEKGAGGVHSIQDTLPQGLMQRLRLLKEAPMVVDYIRQL